MTSEPANVLIAVICLGALVLAGGITQTLVPEEGEVGFVIDRGGTNVECPEDRLIKPCWNRGANVSQDIWRIQLFQPFLEEAVTVNGTPTPTPTPTPSSSGGTGSESTTTATGDGAMSDGGEGGQSTRMRPTATIDDREGAGIGLGRDVDWLLWPLLGLIGVVMAIGIGYGVRGGSIARPRDLLAVPGYVRDVLLSVLVGGATRFGSWFQARWQAMVELLSKAFEPTATPHARGGGRRLPGLIGVLQGIGRLPVVLLDRLRNEQVAEGSEEGSKLTTDAEFKATPSSDEVDVNRAWAWLAERTTSNRSGSQTPEDIARDAVDRGYPREAVEELLAAFRDVTYGGFEASGDRLRTARRAYDAIREAEEHHVEGGD